MPDYRWDPPPDGEYIGFRVHKGSGQRHIKIKIYKNEPISARDAARAFAPHLKDGQFTHWAALEHFMYTADMIRCFHIGNRKKPYFLSYSKIIARKAEFRPAIKSKHIIEAEIAAHGDWFSDWDWGR